MLNLWGPILWKIIHITAFNANDNFSKNKYIEFYKTFAYIIPCSICKNEYLRKINLFPLEKFFNNKNDMINWTILIHNSVNRINRIRDYTYDETIIIYKNKHLMREVISFYIIYLNHLVSFDINKNNAIINFTRKLINIIEEVEDKEILIEYMKYTDKHFPNGIPNYIIFQGWLKNIIDIFKKKYS